TLSVAVQTVGNGGAVTTSTVKATASLNAATKLPVVTAPVFTPDGNGDGGGTFTATLPAGATEGYVQIVDYGPGGGPNDGAASKSPNCQGPRGTQFAPVYYTFEIVPGTTNYTLAPTIGPSTSTTGGVGALSPSPSVCTLAQNQSALGNTTSNGDDIVVQFIAFDYPAYEAAVGLTKSGTPQNPPLTAGAGQADITISQPVEQDNGGTGTPTPISIHRNPQRAPLPRSIRH
ncbi:MAG: hypothetical protein JOZ38_04290, partial [Candidatus Eremiobacteraeota bacterium]|nr:hypothetical protein [Candidatus Eremiobacteraeota bacterium]